MAITSAPVDGQELPEPDPELEALTDRRTWTIDRKLMAQFINAINTNTVVSGNWKKGEEPKFPTVGPIEWHSEEEKPKTKKKAPSVLDAMRAMGFDG